MNYAEPKVIAMKSSLLARSILLLAGAIFLHGCSSAEKEAAPLVTVQVTPAKRGPIELEVTSDAVVYPLQQAIITPKITSTIAKFYVQRGTRVKQGQLLALLENRDLAGAAEQSKGEFEQAEASYATTIGASLPQQIQKAELDAHAAKLPLTRSKKSTTLESNCTNRARFPAAISTPPTSHSPRPAAPTSRRRSSWRTSSAWARSKPSNPRAASFLHPRENS